MSVDEFVFIHVHQNDWDFHESTSTRLADIFIASAAIKQTIGFLGEGAESVSYSHYLSGVTHFSGQNALSGLSLS